MKKLLVLALMSNILTAGCSKGTVVNKPWETVSNVRYGPDPKQVYDIYLPSARTSSTTKVMFLFHGGGWYGGDKSDLVYYIESLKKSLPGYAFVNVNYRLANYTGNHFPTQENDVSAAVDFVMSRSADYAVSDKMVVMGASAGAHLALLQAYKHNKPYNVKAVVSFFAPTDILDMYNNPQDPQIKAWLPLALGGTPAQSGPMYFQSSPVNYVTNQSAPTLLFQGGLDPVVNPSQATLLKNKLDSAGVANKLVWYANEGHGWVGSTLTDSFSEITMFLDEHVK